MKSILTSKCLSLEKNNVGITLTDYRLDDNKLNNLAYFFDEKQNDKDEKYTYMIEKYT